MPAAKRTRTPAAQPTPPPRLEDCHESVQAKALELAGGDRRRIETVDTRTVRVVNAG